MPTVVVVVYVVRGKNTVVDERRRRRRRRRGREGGKSRVIARACRDATRFHYIIITAAANLVDATTTTSKPSSEEERYYEPSREEIERALERSGKDAMSAMALVQRQMAIKIDKTSWRKRWNLLEGVQGTAKKETREEDKRDRDPRESVRMRDDDERSGVETDVCRWKWKE